MAATRATRALRQVALWGAGFLAAPPAGAQLAVGDLTPLAWQRSEVLAPTEGELGEDFGVSVALGKDLAVVSAVAANGLTGRVHVFSRQGGRFGGSADVELAPEGLADGATFGRSVAVHEGLIAVGAPRDGSCGSAYLFERDGSGFSELPVTLETCKAGARFGTAIAVTDDTLVVGASSDSTLDTGAGAAYVFVRQGATWVLQAQLLAADAAEPGARAMDLFGVAVALEQDTIVVGAMGESAAYRFERTNGSWARVQRFAPSEAQDGDNFGVSVSLRGDLIAVGASRRDGEESGFDAGAVYAYVKDGVTWPSTETQLLLPAPASDDAGFGHRLGLGNGVLAVAAPYGDWGYKVHTFVREGELTPRNVLPPDESEVGDAFATSVAVFDRTVLVGVPNYDEIVGGAHLFALSPGNACDDADDCAQGFCGEGLCCSTACDGTCESCVASRKISGESGKCGLVHAGTDPRGACAAAACVDATTENPADVCDALGACVASPARACQGYACSVDACLTACSEDADCDVASGFVCNEGKCQVPLGGPCADDSVCGSGYCSLQDGICCNERCDGVCESCSGAKKGAGADGICGASPNGMDPDEECEAAPEADPCGPPGSCNGRGQCRAFAVPTQPCGPTECFDDTKVRGSLCNGEGGCELAVADCELTRCEQSKCAVECAVDQDCADGAFCDRAGSCQRPRNDGADCGSAHECESGYCVDAVCSSTARCSIDESEAVNLQNERRACHPFKCRLGDCLEACTDSGECAPGIGCNKSMQRCVPETARSARVAGCTLSGPAPSSRGFAFGWVVFSYFVRRRLWRGSALSRSILPRTYQ